LAAGIVAMSKRLVLDHLAQYQTVIVLQNGDLPDPPQVLAESMHDG
jgi:hypothetical protein